MTTQNVFTENMVPFRARCEHPNAIQHPDALGNIGECNDCGEVFLYDYHSPAVVEPKPSLPVFSIGCGSCGTEPGMRCRLLGNGMDSSVSQEHARAGRVWAHASRIAAYRELRRLSGDTQ